jgi:hypothetical protein
MPKRILDFDALWASDKLAACQEQNRVEYAWLYGLADANGSFEMTNLRVIFGKVSAIRPSLTLERLDDIFRDFSEHGLLFRWEENGKKYAHWVGSDKPGRLPNPAHRGRYSGLAPKVPESQLVSYMKGDIRSESGPTPDRIGFGIGLGLDRNGLERRDRADKLRQLERALEQPNLISSERQRIKTELQKLREVQ